MFKSPGRNQRSKGIRVKHVLQVCFLLAICFWLIYQVKHSHDKKKALLETDAKQSARTEPTGDILKLGRKDPILKEEKPESDNGKLNEEVEDEETIGNDEENKNEEAVQEEEETGENKDDDGGEEEADEIDEHELEKTDEEVDRDEEVTEEEKGEEEKENKDKDGEDSIIDSVENENSSKEHDDIEDETTTEEKEESTHEAREENYKADDASSAVTQTSQGVEKSGKDSLRDENPVNNTDSVVSNGLETTASSTGGREIAEIDVPLNTITNEAVEDVADKSENGLSEQSNSLHQLMNDTAQINTLSDHLSVQKGTETMADGTLLKNVTLEDTTSKDVSAETTDLNQAKNSILSSGNNESHDAASGSDTTAKTSINSSEEAEGNLQSSDIKSNINNEANPNTIDSGALLTMDDVTMSSENADDVHNDPIDSSDSSISLEEKNDEKDIEMLANFALNKDGNNEDAAAAE